MSGAPVAVPLVLSAPSGAGKTTLANRLRERNPGVVFSVSATTRAPRPGEVDGVHYHFVGRDEFLALRDRDELIEWAEVHGNYYGTPLDNVRRAKAAGRHLLLDIDVQGARQIRRKVPDAVLVFVLPPSGHVLAQRLEARGTEDRAVLRRRLTNAEEEILSAPEFDFVVVNDDLETAVAELEAILRGEGETIRCVDPLDAHLAQVCAEIDAHLDAAADTAGEPGR